MPWIGAAVSVGGSLLGGLMGGSKEGERNAKDAAAAAKRAQEDARRQARADLSPYMESGQSANKLLSQYLGTGDPEGYAPRPTRQQFEDAISNEHFNRFGKDYNRNSNMAVINQRIDREYQEAMKKWEAGKQEFLAKNPNSRGDGRLLKEFTNEDFVRDPGYEARMLEGEKGNFRSLAAGGNLNSGRALKALERYRQDYASNEFGNAYNRDAANKQRIYSFLGGEKQLGIGAAGTSIGVAQNTANNIGNFGINAANQVNQMQQNRQDNQSNAFQSALGNLVYGIERNRSVLGKPAASSGTSEKPWYYSG